jgi:ubiquinone/menaquinone biosynthesis C-methylase UbiE
VILEALRCPVSGAPLHREGDELVAEDGKHRYPLHAGRIPLFAESPASRDAARQQHHYDQLAPRYLENLAYPHTEAYAAQLDRVFLEVLGEAPLGRVAELCCGQGEALGLLQGRIDIGIGVDISLAMLEAAAARLPDGRNAVVQGDATCLPLGDEQFDCVFMFGGIHHVADRGGLFREVARVLAPGGRFLWREPVSDFLPWRALRALIYRWSPALDHETERPLLYNETVPHLERAGLTLRSWRTCAFLGFCLLMNSDVLVLNRGLRFVPGIRRLAEWAARFDEWCVHRPGLRRAGLQVVGCAQKGSLGPGDRDPEAVGANRRLAGA